jgi:hypothetical protein
MPRGKRNCKRIRSISTASIQEEDLKNLQEGSSGLEKLITSLEDFDMQRNFIVLIVYR